MSKKIIIVGPGGSGKDYLRRRMVERGFTYGISHTTRPKRDGEVDGEDYYFTDRKFFEDNEDKFLELQTFNVWKYGITKKEFQEKDLFILSPAGLRSLPTEIREKCFVIYLNPPGKVRLERLNARNDADDAERRFVGDIRDFFEFSDYDIIITNEDF